MADVSDWEGRFLDDFKVGDRYHHPHGPTLRHSGVRLAIHSDIPETVLAAGREPIRLSWRVSTQELGLGQLAYEVGASLTADFASILATTGEVSSHDQIGIPAPGSSLRSREVRFYRARIRMQSGWSDWSEPVRVEAGLLEAADWLARPITLPGDQGIERQAPVPLLRREFRIAFAPVSARLHVTSLGLNRIAINGRPVSNDLLSPGWTSYGKRLLADTYNVTHLLRSGVNVISAILGDGWYRGRLAHDPTDPNGDRRKYGDELGLIAQLEIEDGNGIKQTIATDETWRASTGEILMADLYDGTDIDLRARHEGWELPGFDDGDWQPVKVLPFDPAIIEPRMAPPVRIHAVLHTERSLRPDGSVLLDCGQNISGYVRLRVRGSEGDRVTVRHAEVLEPDGSLHVRSLGSARATDTYVLADGGETELEPVFTFHGFRYAEVRTDAEIVDAEFVAISSALPERSRFESSHSGLNRLHANALWSWRDNSVSLPTDCPQRAERLGWTGDIQAFASTACTLTDAGAFLASWLRDLELDQDDRLGVPSVVPAISFRKSAWKEAEYGRAGWADAATIVPRALYDAYGDRSVLAQTLDSMRRWVDSLDRRAESDGLIGSSLQFGDWLDPDAPSDRPQMAKTDADYLANAYYAYSAHLVADASAILGDADIEQRYRQTYSRVARATWERWRDHAVTTQTGCAVALQLKIAPETERDRVAQALAELVRAGRGRVSTGFLGTPLVLPALAQAGAFDEAYLMLLRREAPSWLYQVDMGATTIWERWDAIRPDRSIHDGRMARPDGEESSDELLMLSFNHYAFGAVVDWVYRHVAGVAPDLPGYRRIRFAPVPTVGIDRASASVETAYGPVTIAWRIVEDGRLDVSMHLPFGTTGIFVPPGTDRLTVDGVAATGEVTLDWGRHRIVVPKPRLAGTGRPAAGHTGAPAR